MREWPYLRESTNDMPTFMGTLRRLGHNALITSCLVILEACPCRRVCNNRICDKMHRLTTCALQKMHQTALHLELFLGPSFDGFFEYKPPPPFPLLHRLKMVQILLPCGHCFPISFGWVIRLMLSQNRSPAYFYYTSRTNVRCCREHLASFIPSCIALT